MRVRLGVLTVTLLVAGCRATGGPQPQAVHHAQRGAQYLESGQPALAKQAFELCLEFSPDYPICLNGLGLVAMQAGLPEEGATWFRKAIKANRDFAEARANLGVYFEGKQAFDRAIELYESALGIDPGYQAARYNLARTSLNKSRGLAARNRTQEAITLLGKAENQLIRLAGLAPLRADGFALLASVYMQRADLVPLGRQADLERARVTFGQCLSAHPTYVDCLALGAFLAHAMGDCDLANERIATLQQIGTGLERIPGLQDQVQACLASRDAGIRQLQLTWEKSANQGNVQPLMNLCAHFVARRVVREAQSYCRHAMKRAPKAAGLRRIYAEFLIELQQPGEALAVCEEVLRLPATNEPDAVAYCREAVRTLRLAVP